MKSLSYIFIELQNEMLDNSIDTSEEGKNHEIPQDDQHTHTFTLKIIDH